MVSSLEKSAPTSDAPAEELSPPHPLNLFEERFAALSGDAGGSGGSGVAADQGSSHAAAEEGREASSSGAAALAEEAGAPSEGQRGGNEEEVGAPAFAYSYLPFVWASLS